MNTTIITHDGESAMYCIFCGNNPAPQNAHLPCPSCAEKIEGVPLAFQAWLYLNKTGTRCCGGLSSDGTHLYFHGKHWDGEYASVWCEYGVKLYGDRAVTYAIIDTETFADSAEFGDPLPYPSAEGGDRAEGWDVWYNALQAALALVPHYAHDFIAETEIMFDMWDAEDPGFNDAGEE